MPTPSKAEQEAEGANREAIAAQQQRQGIRAATPEEIAAAGDGVDDTSRSELPPQQRLQDPGDQPAERAAPPTPRVDQKRADIVSRFRQDRTTQVSDRDEISDFARSGLPQDFAHPVPDLAAEEAPVVADPEETPQVATPQAQPPQPKKVKVKVRGQEMEITEDEYHAAAQKALAADNYLDEARSKLDQVDALLRDTRTRAQHPGQPSEHPAGQNTVQPGEPEPHQPVEPQQPEDDPLDKAIEAIQYGDPAEAKTLLNNTIERRAEQVASKVVTNTLQSQKVADEIGRSKAVLEDFKAQHPELASDPRARAAMEATVYELQIEDLKELGVDPSQIKTQTGRVTPADIAQAHLWYRVNGYKVRSPAVLLQKAHTDFLEWKGTPNADGGEVDPNPQPPVPPRVEVRVDRDQRRQAIPTQPSRSAAPQRPGAPVQTVPQTRDRSQIVADMQAKRARPRGQVTA